MMTGSVPHIPLKVSAIRPIGEAVSHALTDLIGEIPAVRDEPSAARTGVWTIRPNQALRWARRSPTPGEEGGLTPAATVAIRAVGVVSAVLLSGMLGGVGAWALSALT